MRQFGLPAGLTGNPNIQEYKSRFTTLCVNNAAEKEEPQPQNKRGRLTTLHVSNEAKTEASLRNTRNTLRRFFNKWEKNYL